MTYAADELLAQLRAQLLQQTMGGTPQRAPAGPIERFLASPLVIPAMMLLGENLGTPQGAARGLLAGLGAYGIARGAQAAPQKPAVAPEQIKQAVDVVEQLRDEQAAIDWWNSIKDTVDLPPAAKTLIEGMVRRGDLAKAADILKGVTWVEKRGGKLYTLSPLGVEDVEEAQKMDPEKVISLKYTARLLQQNPATADLGQQLQALIEDMPEGVYRIDEKGRLVREGGARQQQMTPLGAPKAPDVPGGLAVLGDTTGGAPDVPGGLAVLDDQQSPQQPTGLDGLQIVPTKIGSLEIRGLVSDETPVWRPVYDENGVIQRIEWAPAGTPVSKYKPEEGWRVGPPPKAWQSPEELKARAEAAKRAAEQWRTIVNTIFDDKGRLNVRALLGIAPEQLLPARIQSWIFPRTGNEEAAKLRAAVDAFIADTLYTVTGAAATDDERAAFRNMILPDVLHDTPETVKAKLKAFENMLFSRVDKSTGLTIQSYFKEWRDPLDEIEPDPDQRSLKLVDLARAAVEAAAATAKDAAMEVGKETGKLLQRGLTPQPQDREAVRKIIDELTGNAEVKSPQDVLRRLLLGGPVAVMAPMVKKESNRNQRRRRIRSPYRRGRNSARRKR